MAAMNGWIQFAVRMVPCFLIAVPLAGCAKDRIPATTTQDPFLNSTQGRPASRVEPAPARRDEDGRQSKATEPGTDISALTTGRVEPSGPERKGVGATLMAPAESLSSSNANLAMQASTRTQPTAAGGVQQVQWQSAQNQAGLEQAFARLQQLGVLEQRLELRGGQWTFYADVPNPREPGKKRRIEGMDATPFAAVRGVLEQIEAQPR